MHYDLQRFIDAQQRNYATALAEVQRGQKREHWMWYIFPQIKGLGFSQTSVYYAIQSPDEAYEYLENTYLHDNLVNICNALLALSTDDPVSIFGHTDAQKLRSSMTLFDAVSVRYQLNEGIFKQVIDKFFHGQADAVTVRILNSMQ